MTPATFDYLRADSLDGALEALAEHGSEAAVLAGGQSLVPMLCLRLARPGVVVDIGGLTELSEKTARDGRVSLGALVRHRDVERDGGVARNLPLLAEAARWVATPTIRNVGTLGGALALGDPAAEYPAVALALDARLRLVSRRGARVVAAEDFYLGAMETAAEPDELLVGLEAEAAAPGDEFGFCEIAQRRGDYALAGAAVLRRAGGEVRVALFGAGEVAFLCPGAGSVLSGGAPGTWSEATLRDAAEAARTDLGERAVDAFRSRLAGVAVRRAAAQLAERMAA